MARVWHVQLTEHKHWHEPLAGMWLHNLQELSVMVFRYVLFNSGMRILGSFKNKMAVSLSLHKIHLYVFSITLNVYTTSVPPICRLSVSHLKLFLRNDAGKHQNQASSVERNRHQPNHWSSGKIVKNHTIPNDKSEWLGSLKRNRQRKIKVMPVFSRYSKKYRRTQAHPNIAA